MPFGSRKKKSLLSIIKNTLFYLVSFSRTRKLISLSLKRLKGSPNELAIGLSSGIAVSFTPFIGFHALIALSLAWILRGSMAAALVGTLFGNPWTFPFLWYISIELGNFFFENFSNGLGTEKINFFELKQEITTLILLLKNIFVSTNISEIQNNLASLKLIPIMTVGSIPLVFIAWFMSYFFFVKAFSSYHVRLSRRKKK